MNKTKQILWSLSEHLQLPGDLMANMPKLELTGRHRASIEPHRGLLEYGEDQITLDTSLGAVQISGRNLHICTMNRQRITIEGAIQRVSWPENIHE